MYIKVTTGNSEINFRNIYEAQMFSDKFSDGKLLFKPKWQDNAVCEKDGRIYTIMKGNLYE